MMHVAARLTFFMIPAFRLENVMWRRDLSLMNLISILRRSRLPFSSSSSSSSAGAGRWRLTPRASVVGALPLFCGSSSSVGEFCSCCSVMSAMMKVVQSQRVSVQSNRLYHTEQAGKGKKWWRYCFERGADGSILNLESRRRGGKCPSVAESWLGALALSLLLT